jgi:hypothetical protein
MGVRGLSSFLGSNLCACSDRVELTTLAQSMGRRVELAVDGMGLAYFLFRSGKFDWKYGGDMFTFSQYVIDYVCTLRACHVDLFVVLDGILERGKQATKLSRMQAEVDDMLVAAHHAAHCWSLPVTDPDRVMVLPMFVVHTLVEALREARVQLVRAEREADGVIAAACAARGCLAVLSNDSDFAIFDVPGFIPFWALFADRGT